MIRKVKSFKERVREMPTSLKIQEFCWLLKDLQLDQEDIDKDLKIRKE